MTRSKEEQLQLASDPGTPAEVLAQLYARGDIKLKKALAQNPNTPKELLLLLAAKHPVEVLNNPSFELLFIEDPSVFASLSYEAKQAMIDHVEAVPAWLIEIMIQGYASRLARQPKTPAWALDYLSRAKSVEIRRALAGNTHLSEALFWSLSEDPARMVQCIIARNPGAPLALLWALAENPQTSIRVALAENNALSEELLWYLSDDPAPHIRAKIARHSKATPALLERLSHDDDHEVIANTARSPAASLPLLERLAAHPSLEVRCGVARSPYLRRELPSLLSQLPPENPLLALFNEPSAQQRFYWEALLYDGYSYHPAMSLEGWSKSPHALLRRIIAGAARGGNLPAELAEDAAPEVREALLFNRHTAIERIEYLLHTRDLAARLALASRQDLPEHLLELLAEDHAQEVRLVLASKEFLSRGVVELLRQDPHPAVQQSAAVKLYHNPPEPEEVLPEAPPEHHEEPSSLVWIEPEQYTQPPTPDDLQWEDLSGELGDLIKEIRDHEPALDSIYFMEDDED